jgi:hypothetical protein
MGTNFYWVVPGCEPREHTLPTGETIEIRRGYDDMDPKVHLGKRSGAGMFCWDCRVTLCKGGNEMLHTGRSEWFDRCPLCHKSERDRIPTRFDRALSAEEAPEAVTDRNGVSYCCSFSWAQNPETVRRILAEEMGSDRPLVEDEYRKTYTAREFVEVLADCPIEFTELIGREFC